MGRYYSGDIEGKFWFGNQSSNDAEFFGVEPQEPNEIDYYIDKEKIEEVKNGILKCRKELGKFEKKLNKFFKENGMYNDDQLARALEIKVREIPNLMEWYARLEIGLKIEKCLEENDCCNFSAEL